MGRPPKAASSVWCDTVVGMTTTWTMTIDCTDPALVARFWCMALGYLDSDPPKGWDTWDAFLTAMNVPEAE